MSTVQSYLTPARLANLSSYKYSAIDKSPLSNYVMRHYWVWAASLMPPDVAPNSITTIGFSAILFNLVSVWIWGGSLGEGGSASGSWLYLSCALGLFFYQTMDVIDGKQARRTGTSSPLGELFDHGLDTLNTPLSGLIQAFAMSLGHSPYTLLCILVGCWSMYLSTWEEFHTGTLYLGWINGPVEGILIAVGILATSGIAGPGFWAMTVQEAVGFNLPLFPASTQLFDLNMLFVTLAFLGFHLPPCLLNVHRTLDERRGTRPLNGTAMVVPSTIEAFEQLAPMVVFSVLSAGWTMSPWSVIMKGQHMIEFALVVCLLFGQLSTKIILAHLTKGPFPYTPVLLVPLAIGAIGVNTPWLGLPNFLPPSLELLLLHWTLFLAAISHFLSSSQVITAFCRHLGIQAFSVPADKVAAVVERERAEKEERRKARDAARKRLMGRLGLGPAATGRARSNTSGRELAVGEGREASRREGRVE